MLKRLLSLFKQDDDVTDLKSHLTKEHKVKIQGVIFHLRKIQIMNYLEGARVMQEMFSVYKTKDEKRKLDKGMVENMGKAKAYMTDIIMAGVIKPELTRDKNNHEAVHVDDIFNDWIMAQELVKEILELTHGKKK